MNRDVKVLGEDSRIIFGAPLGPRDSPLWPSSCRNIFRHIRQINTAEPEHYQGGTSADSLYKPWKEQTVLRSKQIARLAKGHVQKGENAHEPGLNELERVVLARFSVEVAWYRLPHRTKLLVLYPFPVSLTYLLAALNAVQDFGVMLRQ